MIPALVRLPALALAVFAMVQPSMAAKKIDPWPPPSPYRILGATIDGPPLLDAVHACLPPGGAEGSESELARAITASRDAEPQSQAAARLLELVRAGGSPLGIACAELELARLALRAGSAQARAHALRANRAFGVAEPPAAVRRAAVFYRAESIYRSGDATAAKALYVELESGSTRVALAARLRLADIAYEELPDREGIARMEDLVAQAAERGLEPALWGPRLAEWRLHEDLPEALAWLERAPDGLTGADAGAVAVRRADLLYQMGEADAAREALRGLADSARSAAARTLAVVRLVDLWRRLGDTDQRQLERAAASERQALRAYTRAVLARSQLATGDLHAALEVLVRLVHDGLDRRLAPTLPAMFDEVAVGLTEGADCEPIVASVGGRRDLLMRNATNPDPFLRLGDCYLELGLGEPALDIYRSVARVFGPTVVSRLTLRTARAEARTGRLAQARAAARASVARADEPTSGWRTLYAEILLADGRPQEAAQTLEPVVRRIVEGSDTGPTGSRALLLCARAAVRHRAPKALVDLLRTALARSRVSPETTDWLAESALLIADLHRIAGDFGRARRLYGPAFAALGPGPLRSRAGYWSGVLAGDDERAREIWSQIAGDADVWGRLAANEIGLSQGRAAVGAVPEVPESRRLVAVRSAAE